MVFCGLFTRAKVDAETADVWVDEVEAGHGLRRAGCILRGGLGAIYLCLISLGRGQTGSSEILEGGIWGIFWSGGDDGRGNWGAEYGGRTGMGRGGDEGVWTMGLVMVMVVLLRDGEMGLRWGRLGVGRVGVVVGRGWARRVRSAPVNRGRVVIVWRRKLVHLRVIGRALLGLSIIWTRRRHRRLVVGRGRAAKDGLVRLVALVWLTWASWPLHLYGVGLGKSARRCGDRWAGLRSERSGAVWMRRDALLPSFR